MKKSKSKREEVGREGQSTKVAQDSIVLGTKFNSLAGWEVS